jgi:hypothetical protein
VTLPRLVVETRGPESQNGRLIMGGGGPHSSFGKKVLNYEIFIIGYLQFVETKHLHAALYLTGYEASTAAVYECYCNTFKELFHEVILKLARWWQ